MFYVYELIDPASNEVFYVGKGSGSRYLAHEKEASMDPGKWTNTPKCQRIRSILERSESIKYIIHPFTDEHDAYTYERGLINKYGRLCKGSGKLTNMLPGGKGGKPLPVFVFQRSDGSFIGEFSSQHEASVCLNVSQSTISETLSNNQRGAKQYLFSKTPHPPLENIKNQITVYELPNKSYVGSFDTTYAVADAIGVSQTVICRALAGKQRLVARRYIVAINSQSTSLHRVVARVCPTSSETKLYANLTDAMVDNNVDRSSILRSIRDNNTHTAANYLWRYVIV